MTAYAIDTHALIWFISRDRRLGRRAREILRDPDVRLVIPAIVLAEVKYLAHRGRFAQTLDDVLRVLSIDPRCTIMSSSARPGRAFRPEDGPRSAVTDRCLSGKQKIN